MAEKIITFTPITELMEYAQSKLSEKLKAEGLEEKDIKSKIEDAAYTIDRKLHSLAIKSYSPDNINFDKDDAANLLIATYYQTEKAVAADLHPENPTRLVDVLKENIEFSGVVATVDEQANLLYNKGLEKGLQDYIALFKKTTDLLQDPAFYDEFIKNLHFQRRPNPATTELKIEANIYDIEALNEIGKKFQEFSYSPEIEATAKSLANQLQYILNLQKIIASPSATDEDKAKLEAKYGETAKVFEEAYFYTYGRITKPKEHEAYAYTLNKHLHQFAEQNALSDEEIKNFTKSFREKLGAAGKTIDIEALLKNSPFVNMQESSRSSYVSSPTHTKVILPIDSEEFIDPTNGKKVTSGVTIQLPAGNGAETGSNTPAASDTGTIKPIDGTPAAADTGTIKLVDGTPVGDAGTVTPRDNVPATDNAGTDGPGGGGPGTGTPGGTRTKLSDIPLDLTIARAGEVAITYGGDENFGGLLIDAAGKAIATGTNDAEKKKITDLITKNLITKFIDPVGEFAPKYKDNNKAANLDLDVHSTFSHLNGLLQTCRSKINHPFLDGFGDALTAEESQSEFKSFMDNMKRRQKGPGQWDAFEYLLHKEIQNTLEQDQNFREMWYQVAPTNPKLGEALEMLNTPIMEKYAGITKDGKLTAKSQQEISPETEEVKDNSKVKRWAIGASGATVAAITAHQLLKSDKPKEGEEPKKHGTVFKVVKDVLLVALFATSTVVIGSAITGGNPIKAWKQSSGFFNKLGSALKAAFTMGKDIAPGI